MVSILPKSSQARKKLPPPPPLVKCRRQNVSLVLLKVIFFKWSSSTPSQRENSVYSFKYIQIKLSSSSLCVAFGIRMRYISVTTHVTAPICEVVKSLPFLGGWGGGG